jgi:hypothetical protein
MDWRDDQRNSELYDIIDLVWHVEELDIGRLRDLCDSHQLHCEQFISVWRDLCTEAHILITQAEERMH